MNAAKSAGTFWEYFIIACCWLKCVSLNFTSKVMFLLFSSCSVLLLSKASVDPGAGGGGCGTGGLT